ncbi:hypothetical protein [Winogradskyella sp. UBA3174]|uniref:hypothetical protein n=1 Tax=Winogradskyella sp. UBA3174 TaxID=1947785 RepID=UPI0025E9ED8F|nr:hypothetical protein [Winogradskyella sp. UBA3174]|tara:strand:- start:473 stop:826 length:354 start_codon:yes stop_codon:yes gene_type:complete
MDDIKLIYCNYFGTSFFLKRCTISQLNKVQLVFGQIAFDFTNQELVDLQEIIKSALSHLGDIDNLNNEIDLLNVVLLIKKDREFHFAFLELKALEDLINGTLFHLNFHDIISDLIAI